MTNITTIHPTGVIADHIAAVNAFDIEAVMATFADDALVNDAHREFWGADAVRAWVAKEIVGDHVTLDPVEVLEHHGMTIVHARYDGDYPKDNLPDPLILSNYLVVRDGRIVTLFVIHNTPVEGY